jgi:hypothetical protein
MIELRQRSKYGYQKLSTEDDMDIIPSVASNLDLRQRLSSSKLGFQKSNSDDDIDSSSHSVSSTKTVKSVRVKKSTFCKLTNLI